MPTRTLSSFPCLVSLLSLPCVLSCSTEEPALNCESTEDCPGGQSCLQELCVADELPDVRVQYPEDEQTFAYDNGTPHVEFVTVSADNLDLRSPADSSEAVIGEGHLVVFVDEVEVGVIDTGDASGGVQLEVEIPDVPGVHYIRVQARLSDGTDYDHEGGAARILVWVDDGRQHIALRRPWPGEVFSLEQQLVDAEVAALGVELGPPSSTLQHVFVYYDELFPACLDEPVCAASYVGLLPNDESEFGPVLLPESASGSVTLTSMIANYDHTIYADELGEPVWSSIEVVRSNE